MNYNLSDNELSQVCEVIATRMGLHFPVEKWAILGRNLSLAAHEFGFEEMDEFIHWFLSHNLNQEQIKILASHLTISETYFWREPYVFSALTDFIIPGLVKSKKKGDNSLRIWSIGCSTGEEPYSLAIALHNTVPGIKDWNVSILASDINPRAIEKARSGKFGPWSFRNTPDWIIKKYFHKLEDRKYGIITEIKNMVTFSCQSLAGDEIFASTGHKIDIIFCRNVLMYFTPEWVSKISENIFNSLTEDGWFVVSSSELSSQVFPQFTAVNFPGAVLYRKTKNESANLLSTEATTKVDFNTSTFTRRSLGEGGPSTHSTHFQPQPQPQPLQPSSSLASSKEEPQTNPEETSADKIFAIRLLADQGHLGEALSICNEALVSYKLSSNLYFLRASILQELDKNSEAIASLKQAIYTDPEYIMGHFALGNLFIRQGNAKNAERCFNNVLDLLSRCANDDILPDSEGLSVKYIREIIFANMQTQGIK